MNKKLLRIGVGVGAPIAIAGLVTGIVLGLKKPEPRNIKPSKPASVKDFNDNIEASMQNSFMYPRNGYYLNDKLILLQPDSNDKKNLIMENDKEPKWSETIKFEDLLTRKDIDQALQKVNKDLFDFVNKSENKTKRWGITWQSNANHNWMILNVYHVKKENEDDKKIIDNFINELKNAKANDIKGWVNSLDSHNAKRTHDFLHLLMAKFMPREGEYKSHFPFSWTGESILNTEQIKLFEEKSGKEVNKGVNTAHQSITQIVDKTPKGDYFAKYLKWEDDTKIEIRTKILNGNRSREFNIKLLENKIIPTVEPIVDFAKDSSGKSKLLLSFSFYKLDNNSTINFIDKDDKVENPKNIYLRTISFDMKNIIDNLSKNQRTSIITSNKDTLGKIYEIFSNKWINLIKNSTLKAFLPIINKFIPPIGTSLKDFLSTIEFLNKLKMDKNLLISNKKPLDYIFNDKKLGKKSLSEKILEKINNSDFLMPKDVFDIWFEKFTVGELGDLEKFMSTSNYFDSNSKSETMSSQKLFYYLYAGSKAFEPLIRGRLNELLKDGTLKFNYYEQETKNVINKFINQLKDQNILDESFSIIDLTNKEKRNKVLVKIINAIQNDKQFAVPKEIFSLLHLDNSIATLITSVINSNYIKDLLTLVKGQDDASTMFKDIISDPVNKIISRIMKNIDTDLGKKALGNLSKKVDLKEIIKPLIPQEYKGLIDGFINGFKTKKELIDIFGKIIPDVPFKPLLINFVIGNLYKGDEVSVLSGLGITKEDTMPFSFILKKGIKNSNEKEIGNFLDTVNNIIINKFSEIAKKLNFSKPAILDEISKYLKIILPTIVKQPSKSPAPEAQKLAKLLKALTSK